MGDGWEAMGTWGISARAFLHMSSEQLLAAGSPRSCSHAWSQMFPTKALMSLLCWHLPPELMEKSAVLPSMNGFALIPDILHKPHGLCTPLVFGCISALAWKRLLGLGDR